MCGSSECRPQRTSRSSRSGNPTTWGAPWRLDLGVQDCRSPDQIRQALPDEVGSVSCSGTLTQHTCAHIQEGKYACMGACRDVSNVCVCTHMPGKQPRNAGRGLPGHGTRDSFMKAGANTHYSRLSICTPLDRTSYVLTQDACGMTMCPNLSVCVCHHISA